MLPLLAESYDRLFGYGLAHLVRRPQGALPAPGCVPARPEELPDLGPLGVTFEKTDDPAALDFRVAPARPSPWPLSAASQGLAVGAPKADAAVLVLHGAYETEYLGARWIGQAFAAHGFRALIPVAPYHLGRRRPGALSGAPMFWSTDAVVAGLAQWLAEVRGLIDWLRGQGTRTVGLVGYSLGSLAAGLAASLWDDLAFAAFVAPVGHHLQALPHSHVSAAVWPWMRRLPDGERALLDRWSAFHRRPVVRQLLYLMPLYDQFQPLALQRAWWHAWGEPPCHEYPFGHISLVFCRQLYKDLGAFAASVLVTGSTHHSRATP